ncbi:MAG: hypothetical protein RL173_2332 [Fibrobacterota bacterium]|jgi:hypothetical protein
MKGLGITITGTLLAALLAGCGSEAVVQGGGATETDNSINLLATSSNGTPLPGARVLLVRTDTWLRNVADSGKPTTLSVTTDAQGRVQLESLPPGEWSAQVETLSQACDIPLGRDTTTRILKLQPLSRVDVDVKGQTGSLLTVGTTWKAVIDSSGHAKLMLPPGRRPLVTRNGTTLSTAAVVTLPAGRAIDTNLAVTVTPRRILLDDFSSGDGRTSLYSYIGMGNWFVNSWGTQIYSDANPQGASFLGALSLRYIAPDTGNAVLAGIVFSDKSGFRSMNFSRMDSICFDIRGSGVVDLFFIEWAPDRTWKLSANRRIEGINTSWTRRCMAADSLQDQWPVVKSTANTIAFLAKRGDLLEVRRMELWGVHLQDLSR